MFGRWLASHVVAVFAVVLATEAIPAQESLPSEDEAKEFVREAEERLLDVWIDAARASWVQSTFITHDTEILASEASERAIATGVELAKRAARYRRLSLADPVARKLDLLAYSLVLPGPEDPEKTSELTRISTSLESRYGSGRYCPSEERCLDLQEMEAILAESRDPAELLEVWRGWRTVSIPMKDDYRRLVELANEGARELGFDDVGVLWRSGYDMPPEALAAELDRLWDQVKPFYVSLHAYVRRRLREAYGPEIVPESGPIPAHLLGNMWAQSWSHIYPLVAPAEADPGYDLTETLRARGVGPREMVRYGERFFLSLGFDPLPKSFWERSLFTKPRDREVVCHASAWNIDLEEDLRIKMCIEMTGEDFETIHHELGHNFYQRAYNHQPVLIRDSANDGFHEALGDTIGLSVTPEYLVEVGLLDEAPPASKDIGLLLRMALDKIAFLPFGLLVDQWRWKVFSGEIAPEEYNRAWWRLREEYQGVAAPGLRPEEAFDPGAKYHVAASVPYARYFLSGILQFQFHRALCKISQYEGPLHRCSIYGNKEAGARLEEMMAMGESRPWPEALEVLTGRREMDASAILDYFAPLKQWLDEQNEGRPVGW